uniref:Uncharacterized protein n=1 Tax=viral metagenome TaxID=1070528 RepID=A0A6H1ZAE0_9ZZZZ
MFDKLCELVDDLTTIDTDYLRCPACTGRNGFYRGRRPAGRDYRCRDCGTEYAPGEYRARAYSCPCCGSPDARYQETLGKRVYVCCRDCGWIYAVRVAEVK